MVSLGASVPMPEAAGFAPARLARLSRLVEGYVDHGELAGVSAFVWRRGVPVFRSLCGWADVGARRRITEDTIFRIASMTKLMTAVAAMTFYEEGRFDLNTPISEFLPAYRDMMVWVEGEPGQEGRLEPLRRPITIRHLFTHTSGITAAWSGSPVHSQYRPIEDRYGKRKAGTLAEFADDISRLHLAFQPGTRFQYGFSVDVLGAVLEVISGLRFDALIEERVLGPLRMEDTAFYVPPHKSCRVAAVYTRRQPTGDLLEEPDVHPMTQVPAFMSPGGGLVSTLEDLSRFCQMLLGAGELGGVRVLGRTSVEMFSMNHTPRDALADIQANDPVLMGYGYGLASAVLMDPSSSGTYGTPGQFSWCGGASTYLWVDPKEVLFALLLAQHVPIDFTRWRRFTQVMYQAMD